MTTVTFKFYASDEDEFVRTVDLPSVPRVGEAVEFEDTRGLSTRTYRVRSLLYSLRVFPPEADGKQLVVGNPRGVVTIRLERP